MIKHLTWGKRLAILFISLAVVIMASQALLSRAQLDLTQDKLFTLSAGSRTVLGNLKQPVTLRLYYSETAAAGIPALGIYERQVEDVLSSISRASKGQVKIEIERPKPFSDKEDLALTAGLREVPSPSGESIFFGLVASNPFAGRKVIPFLDPGDQPRLEYDIINLITQLTRPSRPKIAVYTSLPLAFGAGGPLAMMQGNSQPYAIYQQLRAQYTIALLADNFTSIPDDIATLVIAHPGVLAPGQLRSIDQFVNRGGRVLAFVDPFAESAASSRPAELGQPQPAILPGSNMPELLTAWGLQMSPDRVVADGKWARRISIPGKAEALYFLPWIGVQKEGMTPGDLATSGLAMVNMSTAGALEILPRAGVVSSTVLTTSELGGEFPTDMFRGDVDPFKLIEQFRPSGRRYVLAARVTGKLPSAFGLPTGKESAVVVVADSDMLADHVWVQPGQNGQMQAIADNGSFVLNLVDQLSGDPALIGLRGREPRSRAFTILADKQVDAENQLRLEQSRLSAKLKETQSRISALESAGRGTLSAAQSAEVSKFRREVVETRRKLRETQGTLRQSAEGIGRVLMALNIFLVPALILLALAVRSSRRNQVKPQA